MCDAFGMTQIGAHKILFPFSYAFFINSVQN